MRRVGMRKLSGGGIPAFFMAAISAWAQEPPKPQIVTREPLTGSLAIAGRSIAPDTVHRYPLPEGSPIFLHVLVKQVSVDVILRVSLAGETQPATFDATNLGWESLAVVVGAGGGFLDVAMRDRMAKPGEYQLASRRFVLLRPRIRSTSRRRSSECGQTCGRDLGHPALLKKQPRDTRMLFRCGAKAGTPKGN